MCCCNWSVQQPDPVPGVGKANRGLAGAQLADAPETMPYTLLVWRSLAGVSGEPG